jgi:hypothetical protein
LGRFIVTAHAQIFGLNGGHRKNIRQIKNPDQTRFTHRHFHPRFRRNNLAPRPGRKLKMAISGHTARCLWNRIEPLMPATTAKSVFIHRGTLAPQRGEGQG